MTAARLVTLRLLLSISDLRMSEAGLEKDTKPYQATSIKLKVNNQDGNEVVCRMKRRTQLKKLMNVFCNRQAVDMDSICFLFDGKRLSGEQTPDELKMEDGDRIYIVRGCGSSKGVEVPPEQVVALTPAQEENEQMQHLPRDQDIASARFESLQIELDELKAKLLDLPTRFNYSSLTEEMSSIRDLLQSRSLSDKESDEPSRFSTPKMSVVGAVEILLVVARLGYLAPAAIEDPLVTSLIGDRIKEVKAMIASVASSESN